MESVEVFGYWKQNLGDDLFFEILCRRYPNTVFRTAIDPHSIETFSGLDNVVFDCHESTRVAKMRQLARMMVGQFIGAARTSIEIGGSIFIQKHESRLNIGPYLKRMLISLCSSSFYCLGCNFGPYYSQHQLDTYAKYFARLDDVCFRDEPSFGLFSELPNVRFAPDIVLGLDADSVPVRNVLDVDAYTVVSAIDLEYTERNLGEIDIPATKRDYEQFLVRNIKAEIHRGNRVVLFSFCDHEQDQIVNERLLAELSADEKTRVSLYSHHEIADSLALLKSAQKLIATRFHAMILGWVFGTPTYVVTYSKKTNNMIDTYVPEQTFVNLAEVDPGYVLLDEDYYTVNAAHRHFLRQQAADQFLALDAKLMPRVVIPLHEQLVLAEG